MNRFTYSIIFYLATPLIILRLLWLAIRSPAYLKRWSERFAYYSSKNTPGKVELVFHAVSLGEVHAAVPLINRLLENMPELRILVTTSTPTGSARVKELLNNKVAHVYLPYDYPGAIRRFLLTCDPKLLVIMETELWPNLIHGCSKKETRILLANARLSEKSLRNYEKIPHLANEMMNLLDRVTTQSPQDSLRLQSLGLKNDKITVAGSMKYDMTINAEQLALAQQDKDSLNGRPVLIATSTRSADGKAEEAKVLNAFKHLLVSHPNLLLVLVPRHPERFNTVHEMVVKQGLSISLRSNEDAIDELHQVFLGDSLGEMQYYLGLADIAFVGGSLVPTGCQNIIEPAALGLPVITGPSLFNFQLVSEQMQEAGGLIVVTDENELVLVADELLKNSDHREHMGRAALATVKVNQGASEKNLRMIKDLLPF